MFSLMPLLNQFRAVLAHLHQLSATLSNCLTTYAYACNLPGINLSELGASASMPACHSASDSVAFLVEGRTPRVTQLAATVKACCQEAVLICQFCGPTCGLEAVGRVDVSGMAALSWTCIKIGSAPNPMVRVCYHLAGVGRCRVWLQHAASTRGLGQLGTYTQVPD